MGKGGGKKKRRASHRVTPPLCPRSEGGKKPLNAADVGRLHEEKKKGGKGTGGRLGSLPRFLSISQFTGGKGGTTGRDNPMDCGEKGERESNTTTEEEKYSYCY